MGLDLLTLVLIAHFIADFILQTDEMAKGKSTSHKWLADHVFTYTIGIYWMLFITIVVVYKTTGMFEWQFNSLHMLFVWAVLNGVAHYIVDYFTSRWSSSLWKQGRTHDFFVVIGFDQLIHAVTLLATASWLLQG